MEDIEYEYLKSNLRNYLESHGINTNRMFRCINPNHNDSNASMKYYDDNKVYCFGCSETYNLFDCIAILENVDNKEAFKRALQYYRMGKTLSVNKDFTKKQDIANNQKEKDYSRAYKVWAKNLDKEKSAKHYLFSRKIDEKTIKRFNIGYNEFNFGDKSLKAIIIPISKNGFTARNIDTSNNELRYYKTKSHHTDIFNKEALYNDKPFCFITEGEFDCLSLESVGANAIALGSVSNLSKFENLELNKKKIYITAFDNDEAGEKATEDIIKFFKQNKIKYLTYNSVDYKDVNEALVKDEENFKFCIENIVKRAMKKVNEEEMS